MGHGKAIYRVAPRRSKPRASGLASRLPAGQSVAMESAAQMPIVVAGPTASGKSALAMALARDLDGVVINADSMQVYRELRILTARPTDADEATISHRLYGVLSAAEPCSAGRWRKLALDEIAAARAAGRRAILVGGTGLYLKALLDGIAPIPAIPDAVRRQVRALHGELGGAGFHAALAMRDPAGAARLAPGDTQRMIRAYEVIEATGHSLSVHQASPVEPGIDALSIVLSPPRGTLVMAVDQRCAAMLDGGALDEVAALLRLGLDPALPAVKAVGVPVLARHLAGEIGRDEALRLFQQATRQYAKRQVTWFRHQLAAAITIGAQFSESLLPEILRFIRERR